MLDDVLSWLTTGTAGAIGGLLIAGPLGAVGAWVAAEFTRRVRPPRVASDLKFSSDVTMQGRTVIVVRGPHGQVRVIDDGQEVDPKAIIDLLGVAPDDNSKTVREP